MENCCLAERCGELALLKADNLGDLSTVFRKKQRMNFQREPFGKVRASF